eukprot:TRINITY_DN534_c1_g1_i1.p1 TRINITY_DN534_c1_g1~~TRINITY_DN534_c1_g1_i1.p1  ORF type:complete len:883 (-),score=277.91 TRINITY_DN534_c1_g1_i1:39-2687(-)
MTRLLICLLVSLTFSSSHAHPEERNMIFNPSFEIKDGARASGWNGGSDYVIDWDVKRSGLFSIRTHSVSSLGSDGAFQVVILNQQEPSEIMIGAWSKADSVKRYGSSDNYGIRAHIKFNDGSWRRDLVLSFHSGSHDWQYEEIEYTPNKPIHEVWVHILFSQHSGYAWFDDLSLFSTEYESCDHPPRTHTSTSTSSSTTSSPSSPPPSPTVTSTYTPPPSSSGIFTSTGTQFPTTRSDASTTGGILLSSYPTLDYSSASSSPSSSSSSSSSSLEGQKIKVGAKYLILSPTSTDDRLSVVKTTLDSVGMPYDVMIFNEDGTGISGKTIRLEDNNKGLYMGLIATDDFLLYDDTYQQVLNNYQLKYGVKMINMYTYPTVKSGVRPSPMSPSSDIGFLQFSQEAVKYAYGYNISMELPSSGVYTYPAEIVANNMAVPAMSIKYKGSEKTYVAAAFITFPDGRRSLQFYIDHGTWAFHSTAIGSFWLQWLNNGLYLGLRRVNLNMQIDDLFMESEMWDPVTNVYSEITTYRMTPDDLSALSSWQSSILHLLPPTSLIISTFPFNGQTVSEHGGYTSDLLYLRTKSLLDHFYFESHTYTHPYLDNLSYSEVTNELTENYKTAQNLFSNNMNHSSWSHSAMVTPSITGLFNGEALKALWDYGIRSVVGDNTRPELTPAFMYHGLYTSSSIHGFRGIYIVPRFATDVYYCCSIPSEEEALFNFRYETYYGKKSTVKEIMQKEAERVRGYLLAYRQDPYMFHQANLRQFEYEQRSVSLVSLWADHVITEFMKFSTLPIRSQKGEELTKIWQARETRDACMFSAELNVDPTSKQISSITVSSMQSCKYAITGFKTSDPRVISETYGPDTTSWIQMTPGSTITLTPSETMYI